MKNFEFEFSCSFFDFDYAVHFCNTNLDFDFSVAVFDLKSGTQISISILQLFYIFEIEQNGINHDDYESHKASAPHSLYKH